MTRLTPEEVKQLNEVLDDFFAFQVAACTTQPDCTCGRGPEHHPPPPMRCAGGCGTDVVPVTANDCGEQSGPWFCTNCFALLKEEET